MADGPLAEGAGGIDVDVDGLQESVVAAGVGGRPDLAGRGVRQADPDQRKMAVTHRDAANLAEEFVALSEVDDGLVDLGDDDMEALEEQLGLLVVGEIADDDAAGRRVPAVGGRRAGQMGPDERPVFLLQAQFAALRGTGVDQTAAEAGIDGLVFRKDESGQRFVGQGFGRQVEQGGQGSGRARRGDSSRQGHVRTGHSGRAGPRPVPGSARGRRATCRNLWAWAPPGSPRFPTSNLARPGPNRQSARAGHCMSNKLRAMRAMPPTRPSRLSWPLP